MTNYQTRQAIKEAHSRLQELALIVDTHSLEAGRDVREATSDLFAAWSKLRHNDQLNADQQESRHA